MKIKKVNCLIDFFSEEIPASMQLFLEKELNLLFEKVLNKVLLNYEKIEILSSPRHHCVLIHNIDSVQKDQSLDIKGPRIDAPKLPFLQGEECLENISKGIYCYLIDNKSNQTLWMLGDSHTKSLYLAGERVSNSLGMNLKLYYSGGTAFPPNDHYLSLIHI